VLPERVQDLAQATPEKEAAHEVALAMTEAAMVEVAQERGAAGAVGEEEVEVEAAEEKVAQEAVVAAPEVAAVA